MKIVRDILDVRLLNMLDLLKNILCFKLMRMFYVVLFNLEINI